MASLCTLCRALFPPQWASKLSPSYHLYAHVPVVSRPFLDSAAGTWDALVSYHEEGRLRGIDPVRRFPAVRVVGQLLPSRGSRGDFGFGLRKPRR